MALVKRGGRPLKFTDPEKFAEQVDAYFDYCDENDKPYTMSGLGVYLDTSADTLIDYSKKDDFSETIKKAKERIYSYAEESLYRTSQVAGVIFNLKNNWGWKDKYEQDHTSGGDKIQFVVQRSAEDVTKED